MTRHSALWFGGAALLALAAAPALAQQSAPAAPGFVPQPTPTADKLAAAMSTLGRSPQDVEALIAAGEASAALDDTPAALQFLARAEKLRPADPRIAAARGRAFVRMGRPGEALRRFADAERGGLSPATFADDRGLAYDLVGDQAHAQVEYNRALAMREDAELRRRLAISQAISGDQPGAERTLDPLLRQQDRASWRTKALVMALGGNTAGAERVTATMMPGFSTAYLPLFRRLSEIRDPADRAFAAHLGEFTRTPARLADAGLAPAAPPLPQPAPVKVAEAKAPAPAAATAARVAPGNAQTRTPTRAAPVETARAEGSADTRARARERRALERRAEREALMAERYGRRVRRVETAAVDPRRTTGAIPARNTLPVGRTPLPPTAPAAAAAMVAPSVTSAVSANAAPSAGSSPTIANPSPQAGVQPAAPSAIASTAPGSATASPVTASLPQPGAPAAPIAAAPSSPVVGSSILPATAAGSPAIATAGAASPAPVTRAPDPAVAPTAATASPGFSAAAPVPTATLGTSGPPIGREDDVLAMIVRNIAVPAGELGVAPPQPVPAAEPTPAPTPAPTPIPAARPLPAPVRTTPVEPAPIAAAKPAAAAKPLKPAVPPPAETKPADAKKAETKGADARKAGVRNADNKKADAKKADPEKTDPKKTDAKKAEPKKATEPARWWVQVAGGANVADLPKAWNALTAKNPALKKRQAWTTPLRFTNRLLTGPFASSAEAQAYVNTLGKDGLSAFAFQSEAGQKVTRLPAK
mgnify:CR=1 FL=1